MRLEETVVIVDFYYMHRQVNVKGGTVLFMGPGGKMPETDEELVDEIKRQYDYDATEILYKREYIMRE
ncbi:hypothetical protein MKZ17_07970 [Solibacillus sp. FSL R7-0682]|uniref:hypothetical protein n=1 Tax=Solibacillus sp. FSL R7-0682 TaxID=2921690 RepID=UPI0030F837D8